MTIIAVLHSIFIFTIVLAGSLAQPQGGFLDSSKDVVIREANTSIEIPIEVAQPITIFPPYNNVIYQLNNCCLGFADSRVKINAAYGLDKLLMASVLNHPVEST